MPLQFESDGHPDRLDSSRLAPAGEVWAWRRASREGGRATREVWQGEAEKITVFKKLLEGMVTRGLHPDRPELSIIEGGEVFRAGIERGFGGRRYSAAGFASSSESKK